VGIGFAIPTNLAKPVLTQLAAAGHVVRGYLGVTIQRVTADLAKSFGLPGAHGALVASVAEGGPAKAAGLRPGDVIVEYDGRRLERSDELPRLVAETPSLLPSYSTMTSPGRRDRKSTRLNSSHVSISYASFCSSRPPAPLRPFPARRSPDLHGALVASVAGGGPAKAAGLRPGDVIVEYDGRRLERSDELPRLVAEPPSLLPSYSTMTSPGR